MSIRVTGVVVDALTLLPLRNDPKTLQVQKIFVEARGDWSLTTDRLVKEVNDKGEFELVFKGGPAGASARVRAIDVARRPISEEQEVAFTGGDEALKPIKVRQADREGLLVTHLTGAASLVSHDNAIKLLVDGEEAFGRIAADMAMANKTVDVAQLFFPVATFNRVATQEHPTIIFAFGPPPIVPDNPTGHEEPRPPRPRPQDVRPEIRLAELAGRGVQVRILLNDPQLGWEAVFALLALPPAAAGLVAFVGVIGMGLAVLILAAILYVAEGVLVGLLMASRSHVDRARKYFQQRLSAAPATTGSINVRGFAQAVPEHGVLHCKMVIVDDARAVVVGSPFEQRYFDGPSHLIDEPRRGENRDPAAHDVSIALVGPVVGDLHNTLALYWNEEADPAQRMNAIDPSAAQTQGAAGGSGEDGKATLQVIRTLSGRRFKALNGKSEKGILEAYLRAFVAAREFIYIENQYFTNDSIVDGLVNVLTASPIQVILLINIKPDVLLYPRVQASHIARLRAAGGMRFGAFTRWTFAAGPVPQIAQVYLHSKAAVVDDKWVTVGSANLDGLSVDHNILLSPFAVGETTASELNISVVAGPDSEAFAKLARRRLWAEHLGLQDDRARPNQPLDKPPGPGQGWLPLWRKQATDAVKHIATQPTVPLPGFVLEYPDEGGGSLTTPREHLAACKIDVDAIRPIAQLGAFDFFTNRWQSRSVEDPKDLGREGPV